MARMHTPFNGHFPVKNGLVCVGLRKEEVLKPDVFTSRMPLLSLNNSIKALKDDSVADWGQHAVKVGQKHCDGCMGCLISSFKAASLL